MCGSPSLLKEGKMRILRSWCYLPAPQRNIVPGQFVVFYDGDELVGSAVSDR